MIFKILLVIYLLLCALSIKELFNKKNFQKEYNEKFTTEQDKNAYYIAFLVASFVQTAIVITFYSLAYKISPLIGWLSVIQIVWASINWFLSFVRLGELIRGEYKRKPFIYRLITVIFDVIYGVLIVAVLF